MHTETEPISKLQVAKQKLHECERRIAEYEKYQQTRETQQILSEVRKKWEVHRNEIAEIQKQLGGRSAGVSHPDISAR